MSYLAYHKDHEQYRVLIPHTKNLPPNPHFSPAQDALARAFATPSETTDVNSEWTPESRDDKSLRYHLLAYDQRSFFTGSAAADLQPAHIFNTVRKNQIRKISLEFYLSHLGLVPTSVFLLNSLSNAILLEASLHAQWDLYGTFCFVPTEDDAKAMLNALKKSNEQWVKDTTLTYGFVTRPLDVSQAPFSEPHWDILVLHPHALLPEGQPLAILQNRFLYPIGESASQLPQPPQPNWSLWTTTSDHLCSILPPNTPLPPFTVPNQRSVLGGFSCLALAVNAQCKLQQYMQDHGTYASERVQNFAALMSELVAEIFFMPKGYATKLDLQYFSQVTSVTHNMPQPVPEDTMGDVSEPFSAIDAPEVPDPDDGLTDTEFQLLSAKATDGALDPKERADAAMMMIFGTHRYTEPYVPGSSAPHG